MGPFCCLLQVSSYPSTHPSGVCFLNAVELVSGGGGWLVVLSKHGLGIPVISLLGVNYESDGVLSSTKPQGMLGHADDHMFSGLLPDLQQ